MISGVFGGKDITVIIASIISCLSILNYLLAINEYYSQKVYWDYYHVHDKCRSAMCSGFHAEYLSYAMALLAVLVIIFEGIYCLRNYIQSYWIIVYILMCISLSAAIYIFCRLIFWEFHLTDVNERLVWKNIEDYNKFIKVKSNLYLKEYSICCSLMLLGMILSIKRSSLFVLGVFAAITYIFMQFENYSIKQILLSYRKWADITVYEERTYAIIEEHMDYFYLVKCSIDKDSLILYLDNFLIIKRDCIAAETKYFSNMDKYCNRHSCNKHYKIGYRKDVRGVFKGKTGKAARKR